MKHTTLAIESTCDDSSVAIVRYDEGNFVVEKMLTHTQGMHQQFGGVVPEYASREHAEQLPILIDQILQEISMETIDSISVASHPGLPGSVLAGVTAAHALGANYNTPVIETNHIMGHVFSILLDREKSIMELPYLCLTVSGGHSDIYLVQAKEQMRRGTNKQIGKGGEKLRSKLLHIGVGEMIEVGEYGITKLVQTMDDAVGEAFDKVAKMLGGPYPGGPWINTLAREGKKNDLLTSRLRKIDVSDQFSFSGIKAQVHSLVEYLARESIALDDQMRADIVRLFQERVTDAMIGKLNMLIDDLNPNTIGIVGGVSANTVLQEKAKALGLPVYMPTQMKYCTDNAAMIGVTGIIGNRI